MVKKSEKRVLYYYTLLYGQKQTPRGCGDFYFILFFSFCSLDRLFPRLLWLVHSFNSFPFKSTGYLKYLKNVYFHFQLKETSLEKIKNDWEEELGRVIDDDDDDYKCPLTGVNNSTSCCRLSLIQFKAVHLIYFINSKLDMTHMFWNCSRLQGYWAAIFKHLSEALNNYIDTVCQYSHLWNMSRSSND